MFVRSKITGKLYDPDQVWYVSNVDQIYAYNTHGAESEVLDVIYHSRRRCFIYVYPKSDFMKLLYQKWNQNELGNEIENNTGGVTDDR